MMVFPFNNLGDNSAGRLYWRTVTLLVCVCLADMVIRGTMFGIHGSFFSDIAVGQGCEWRDPRWICSGSVRLWPHIQVGIVFCKLVLMAVVISILCRFTKFGGISEVHPDIWKVLALLQATSFLSVVLSVFYFVVAFDYLDPGARSLHLVAMTVSVFLPIFVELGRRRCRQLVRLGLAQLECQKALSRLQGRFPSVRFRSLSCGTGDLQHDSCAICLSDFVEDDAVCQMPCKHIFHAECIRRWLLGSASSGCPMRCPGLREAEAPAPASIGRGAAAEAEAEAFALAAGGSGGEEVTA